MLLGRNKLEGNHNSEKGKKNLEILLFQIHKIETNTINYAYLSEYILSNYREIKSIHKSNHKAYIHFIVSCNYYDK